ncbi:MAG: N-acetylglucosamine-6-phosphate deacetylase [Ruminococcaceae bacterium]|nr:N-acetylglucosamine-6-phosphate deacetylase [Oscillospiraceae bacterium]
MITKISKGKIILEDRVLEGSNVYIDDGVIKAVTTDELEFDKEINAEGYYVSPGFIDLHLHGAADGDFSNASVEENIAAVNYHCKHGTTSLFPTTLSVSFEGLMASLDAMRETMQSDKTFLNICGVHLEGPYFSQNQSGAQNKDFITPPIKEDYDRILEKHGDIISRWSFAPENEGSIEFVETLEKHNVIPSIAHSDAKYDDVMRVYEKGCKLITHFYSCISSITREKGFRKLGIMECGYLLDDMDIEIIADGCHVPKELFKLALKIKTSDNICLVTDAMSCCGSDKTISSLGGVPCKIKSGVAYLMDESAFAGSIATTDRLVRFCVKEAGLSIFEAVKMITVNPARVMKLSKKGKIAAGYDADILLFDDDINIKKVIVGGKEAAL